MWSIQSLRRSIGMAIHWTTFRKRFIAIVAEMKLPENALNWMDISTVESDVLRKALMSNMAMFTNSKLIEMKKGLLQQSFEGANVV